MKRRRKSLEEKINDLDQFFIESLQGSQSDDLKNKLVDLDRYEGDLINQKEDDEDLKQKQEIAKEAGKVYSEGFKAIKLKRQYILRMLSDQGKL